MTPDPLVREVEDIGEVYIVVYIRTPGGNSASAMIPRDLWETDTAWEALRRLATRTDETARALDALRESDREDR